MLFTVWRKPSADQQTQEPPCDMWWGNKTPLSLYRPGTAQEVDRVIALLFHDCGTRRRWVVSSTPRPHFTPGKEAVPILQEAGWAPGPVWTGGKSRPDRDSISNRLACSQPLYRLSYPTHRHCYVSALIYQQIRDHDEEVHQAFASLLYTFPTVASRRKITCTEESAVGPKSQLKVSRCFHLC